MQLVPSGAHHVQHRSRQPGAVQAGVHGQFQKLPNKGRDLRRRLALLCQCLQKNGLCFIRLVLIGEKSRRLSDLGFGEGVSHFQVGEDFFHGVGS